MLQDSVTTSDTSVLEITFESGFGSSSRFHAAFVRAGFHHPCTAKMFDAGFDLDCHFKWF
jgi:transcriptional regulator GlxA family with amidase domain